ncbi:hypothetical protein GQ42DRAFT_176382 [Ramicandelaber brevisporus]|nr:hypothetical protein GQ42DRAFT_176382 [Ramicandelaber brevisporus]
MADTVDTVGCSQLLDAILADHQRTRSSSSTSTAATASRDSSNPADVNDDSAGLNEMPRHVEALRIIRSLATLQSPQSVGNDVTIRPFRELAHLELIGIDPVTVDDNDNSSGNNRCIWISLTSLTLTDCGLDDSGLSAITASVPNCQVLDLTGNLVTLFPWNLINALPQLRILCLARNQIQSLRNNSDNSSEPAATPSLVELDLSDNRISDLSGITALQSLVRLDLTRNDIGIVGELFRLVDLPKLADLYLAANPIEHNYSATSPSANGQHQLRTLVFSIFAPRQAELPKLDGIPPSLVDRRAAKLSIAGQNGGLMSNIMTSFAGDDGFDETRSMRSMAASTVRTTRSKSASRKGQRRPRAAAIEPMQQPQQTSTLPAVPETAELPPQQQHQPLLSPMHTLIAMQHPVSAAAMSSSSAAAAASSRPIERLTPGLRAHMQRPLLPMSFNHPHITQQQPPQQYQQHQQQPPLQLSPESLFSPALSHSVHSPYARRPPSPTGSIISTTTMGSTASILRDPERFRQRMDNLRSEAGDDWLRVYRAMQREMANQVADHRLTDETASNHSSEGAAAVLGSSPPQNNVELSSSPPTTNQSITAAAATATAAAAAADDVRIPEFLFPRRYAERAAQHKRADAERARQQRAMQSQRDHESMLRGTIDSGSTSGKSGQHPHTASPPGSIRSANVNQQVPRSPSTRSLQQQSSQDAAVPKPAAPCSESVNQLPALLPPALSPDKIDQLRQLLSDDKKSITAAAQAFETILQPAVGSNWARGWAQEVLKQGRCLKCSWTGFLEGSDANVQSVEPKCPLCGGGFLVEFYGSEDQSNANTGAATGSGDSGLTGLVQGIAGSVSSVAAAAGVDKAKSVLVDSWLTPLTRQASKLTATTSKQPTIQSVLPTAATGRKRSNSTSISHSLPSSMTSTSGMPSTGTASANRLGTVRESAIERRKRSFRSRVFSSDMSENASDSTGSSRDDVVSMLRRLRSTSASAVAPQVEDINSEASEELTVRIHQQLNKIPFAFTEHLPPFQLPNNALRLFISLFVFSEDAHTPTTASPQSVPAPSASANDSSHKVVATETVTGEKLLSWIPCSIVTQVAPFYPSGGTKWSMLGGPATILESLPPSSCKPERPVYLALSSRAFYLVGPKPEQFAAWGRLATLRENRLQKAARQRVEHQLQHHQQQQHQQQQQLQQSDAKPKTSATSQKRRGTSPPPKSQLSRQIYPDDSVEPETMLADGLHEDDIVRQIEQQPDAYLTLISRIPLNSLVRIDVGLNRQTLTFHFATIQAPTTQAASAGGTKNDTSSTAAGLPRSSITLLIRDRLVCSDLLDTFLTHCYETGIHVVDGRVRVVNHNTLWAIHNLRDHPEIAVRPPSPASPKERDRFSRVSAELACANSQSWYDPATDDDVTVDCVNFDFLKLYYLVGWLRPRQQDDDHDLFSHSMLAGSTGSAASLANAGALVGSPVVVPMTLVATETFFYLCRERFDVWPPPVTDLADVYPAKRDQDELALVKSSSNLVALSTSVTSAAAALPPPPPPAAATSEPAASQLQPAKETPPASEQQQQQQQQQQQGGSSWFPWLGLGATSTQQQQSTSTPSSPPIPIPPPLVTSAPDQVKPSQSPQQQPRKVSLAANPPTQQQQQHHRRLVAQSIQQYEPRHHIRPVASLLAVHRVDFTGGVDLSSTVLSLDGGDPSLSSTTTASSLSSPSTTTSAAASKAAVSTSTATSKSADIATKPSKPSKDASSDIFKTHPLPAHHLASECATAAGWRYMVQLVFENTGPAPSSWEVFFTTTSSCDEFIAGLKACIGSDAVAKTLFTSSKSTL